MAGPWLIVEPHGLRYLVTYEVLEKGMQPEWVHWDVTLGRLSASDGELVIRELGHLWDDAQRKRERDDAFIARKQSDGSSGQVQRWGGAK